MIPKWIIVHHEAPPIITDKPRFGIVDEYHKERFNFKSSLGYWVGYQYFIEKSGTIVQARKDDEEGAHTIGKNTDSIGICLAGNFDLELPTEAQKDALRSLLKAKMVLYSVPIDNIVPHRAFSTKTCFGAKLSDTWAQELMQPLGKKEVLLRQIILLSNKVVELLKKLLTLKGY